MHQDSTVEDPPNAEDKAPPSSPSPRSVANEIHQKASDAAKAGDVPLLRQAFEDGAKPHDIAIQALDNGVPQTYACLLDAGLDPNYRFPGYTGSALICAAKSAKVPLIRLLLDRGADPNLQNAGWGGKRLGALACAAGSVNKDAPDAVKILLRAGARGEGSGALQVASMKGLLGNVSALLEGSVGIGDMNKKVSTESALALAKKGGHEDVVHLLIKHGAQE